MRREINLSDIPKRIIDYYMIREDDQELYLHKPLFVNIQKPFTIIYDEEVNHIEFRNKKTVVDLSCRCEDYLTPHITIL